MAEELPRTLAEFWDITLDKFFADPDDANLELAALLHRAFFTGALAAAMLLRTGATADDLCAEIYAELPTSRSGRFTAKKPSKRSA
jgi:hypothetical protein